MPGSWIKRLAEVLGGLLPSLACVSGDLWVIDPFTGFSPPCLDAQLDDIYKTVVREEERWRHHVASDGPGRAFRHPRLRRHIES
jgi:hypothetical protein